MALHHSSLSLIIHSNTVTTNDRMNTFIYSNVLTIVTEISTDVSIDPSLALE